jgi:hypothetical protein
MKLSRVVQFRWKPSVRFFTQIVLLAHLRTLATGLHVGATARLSFTGTDRSEAT